MVFGSRVDFVTTHYTGKNYQNLKVVADTILLPCENDQLWVSTNVRVHAYI